MKNGYTVHDQSTAPVAAQELLQAAVTHYGFVPNAIGAMAESPVTLNAYLTLDALAGKTGFSDLERHVILLAVTRELECPYCVAAHSAFAKMAAVSDKTVERLRGGEPLDDPRQAALQDFVTILVRRQGNVSDREISAFLAHGYRRGHVLELILLIASKIIAVYCNRIMGTDLDEVLAAERWNRRPDHADGPMKSSNESGGVSCAH
jgi:AhpD family alkylhydroperoxidase